VRNGSGVNLTAVGAVTGGTATATLMLPAGLATGSYTITAAYADTANTNGVVNYASSTSTVSGTLTVNAASTQTTLLTTAISSTYNSTTPQMVTLTADVTSANGGTVNEGMVTFTVGTLTATANVSNGLATATLMLPAGFASGSYTINAAYADSTNANGVVNYNSSMATSPGTLKVNPAGTTILITSTTVNATYDIGAAQTISLSALVLSPTGGTVNEGMVTFHVGALTATAPVLGGVAATTLTLPAGFAAGNYSITAQYSDTLHGNGQVNYASSSSTASASGTLMVAATPAPTPFAIGFGPTGLDWFEIDSHGNVVVQSVFGGGVELVNTSLDLLSALMNDNGLLLALLAGSNGQDYVVDIFNPYLPSVESALLSALHL
jgi:hypothetical protein